LACLALFAGPLSLQAGDVPAPADISPDSQSVPLRSQAALDAWLQQQAGRPTPLDALPEGARQRFLLSLRWGRSGLGGFDPGILADELPQAEIDAILGLFGDELARHAPRSRLPADQPWTRPEGPMSPLERRYDAFYRAGDPPPGMDRAREAARIAGAFDTQLGDDYAAGSLAQLDRRHLAMLWHAAARTAYLTSQDRHVLALQAVFEEYLRRAGGEPSVERLRTMRSALLAARRYEEARRLDSRFPSLLPPLPEFVRAGAPEGWPSHGVWRMSADGTRLVPDVVDPARTRILVTAGCHFSADAAADITADPLLGPVFAANAAWLMLPPGREDIDAVRDWNRRFPGAPALMVYAREGWPMSGDWPMPRFHVVQDGRVVDTVTRWPAGGQHDAIVAMLQRAGLLPAAAP